MLIVVVNRVMVSWVDLNEVHVLGRPPRDAWPIFHQGYPAIILSANRPARPGVSRLAHLESSISRAAPS